MISIYSVMALNMVLRSGFIIINETFMDHKKVNLTVIINLG